MPQYVYLPTPREIKRKTAAIRSDWSDEERERRMRVDLRPLMWTLPEVQTHGESSHDDKSD